MLLLEQMSFFNQHIVKWMNCKQPLWISTTMWLQLGVGKSTGMITQSSILARSIPFRKLTASPVAMQENFCSLLIPKVSITVRSSLIRKQITYILLAFMRAIFFPFPHGQNFVCFVIVIQGGPPIYPYKRVEEEVLSLSKLCDAAGIYSHPGFDLQSWETSKL